MTSKSLHFKTIKKWNGILRTKLPLTKSMGLRIQQIDLPKGVRFKMQLKPNRNHRKTAFGGSMVAAQAIACWVWLCEVLIENDIDADVLLQRQTGEFLAPVNGDFQVQTKPVTQKDIKLFVESIQRHNKARIKLTACVLLRGQVAAQFVGEYVAISSSFNSKRSLRRSVGHPT